MPRLRVGLAAVAHLLLTERQRWPLWLPVGVGAGVGSHFALPAQPPLMAAWIAFALTTALVLAAWRLPRPADLRLPAIVALAAVAVGFGFATLRTYTVAAPILWREGTWTLEARVVAVEPLAKGERLMLDRAVVERLPASATPERIRVNVRSGTIELRPGDRVRLRARLMPPGGPALPGGFDYARQAYFERLGAVGFVMGKVERVQRAEAGGLDTVVADVRGAIARRMTEVVPGASGAMGAALIAGARAGIDDETWQIMQISGLAHLISISGLHMVMVAGASFLLARLALALIPGLAVRVPAQKPAAVVALVATFGYLLLAGPSVPTQRSFLMIAAGLVAVLVDRNPFSLRLLAWAALLVLCLKPESLFGASFQLSFAAVLALIAVHESAGRYLRAQGEGGRGALRHLGGYVLGVSATTVIATVATAPMTAVHFQKIATYGVVANLIAVPITNFIVMPAGFLALPLMALGWDVPFLVIMGWGVDAVLWTAATVSAMPGASIAVSQWPLIVVPLLAIGGLWLALWRQVWRWLGLFPMAAAILVGLLHRPPDLLVDPDLGMALRHDTGNATLIRWQGSRRREADWLRALGLSEAAKAPRAGEGVRDGIGCDAQGCVVTLGSHRISLARTAKAMVEDCGEVDLVVARFGPRRCVGPMVAPWELRRSGGLAISDDGDGLEVLTVAGSRGDWPWARPGVRPPPQ